MSRTARLLELMIRVQARPRFTAQELSDEFGVSRRTMLRDLNALSAMGVPLRSTPGPGGGYALPSGGRRLSLSLTVDEAVGLIIAYEAQLRSAVSPFSAEDRSTVTKLRAALPSDVVSELDRRRRHIAVLEPVRDYDAPLLGKLFRAAVDGVHLKVVYDSAAGISERVIYPYGVFASRGFWYCACHDYQRGKDLSLRADRFRSIAPKAGCERRPHVPVAAWINENDTNDSDLLALRARVSPRGMKRFDLELLFGRIAPDASGGGVVSIDIPRSSVNYFAGRLLGFGPEVVVESPPALLAAMRQQAATIIRLYRQDAIATAEAGPPGERATDCSDPH